MEEGFGFATNNESLSYLIKIDPDRIPAQQKCLLCILNLEVKDLWDAAIKAKHLWNASRHVRAPFPAVSPPPAQQAVMCRRCIHRRIRATTRFPV